MFCTECGYKLEDDFKFCPNCGIKLMESEDKILPQDYMGQMDNGKLHRKNRTVNRRNFLEKPLELMDNAEDLSKAKAYQSERRLK